MPTSTYQLDDLLLVAFWPLDKEILLSNEIDGAITAQRA